MPDKKLKQILINKSKHLKGRLYVLTHKKEGIDFVFANWWKILLFFILFMFILYYPLGGILINKIDTNTTLSKQAPVGKSQIIQTSTHLINREVSQNLWTPNTPFFFPSALLDNMPNFQKGIMSAIANTFQALNSTNDLSSPDNKELLRIATEYVSYSPDVWIIAKTGKMFAPSSNTQYKKGRKTLNKLYNNLTPGIEELAHSQASFNNLLIHIKQDLEQSNASLETQIQKKSDSFADFDSDDLFYYTQGKFYTYCMILKSVAIDYKNTILQQNAYNHLSAAIQALQTASTLRPQIIRNTSFNSAFGGNHLAYLELQGVKTINSINNILSAKE